MRWEPPDGPPRPTAADDGLVRRVLDAWGAGIIVLDQSGRVALINAGWERTGGYLGDRVVAVGSEYLGLCDSAAMTDPIVGQIAEGLRAVLLGTVLGFEQAYPGRGAERGRWFELTARPVAVDGGTGVLVVHEDITTQRGMRREWGAGALLAADGALRAVTDSVRDGVCTLDDQGRVTYVNPQGRRMMRASLNEPLEGSLSDWIHGVGEPRAGATSWPGTASRPLTCRLVRRDGSELHIELVSTALRTGTTGPVTGWVVVFRDISDVHDAETARAQGADEALWLGRVRDALAGDGFVLHAQPIIDLATGKVVQHELLLRMVDPDDPDRVISPARFLPAAEKLGLAPSIDRWVLARGLELAGEGHRIEINISARSLDDPTLPHWIERLLATTGADPAMVVFEITETALLDNDVTARFFADQMRALGCGLALDDFGTGYGGFTYLKHFPLDYLKIDIEFVRDAVSTPASRHVIASIVSLAAAFGLQTVAEGVEDEPPLVLLKNMGVDLAQGYHLGRPAPIADVFTRGPEGTAA